MIKASYEILQPTNTQSFLIRKFDKLAFDAPYHFHEEYELTCIISGSGKRYVGSHMEDFASGDLVLLGPNLPHCWKLEHNEVVLREASAVVIQFNDAFLGEEFFNKFELQLIKKLFQQSGCGVSFYGETGVEVKKLLLNLVNEKSNFRMLIGLLEILHRMASSDEYVLLDQHRIIGERTNTERERINPVFAYLVENFRKHVSLDKAASIANMTPNAFCKYFKKVTRKTFMETIIEYRLNYAIQQLVQTDKPISEISFESGFGDVSHFYKMFKAKMNLSPLNYRKRFMRNLAGDKKLSA
ncbi:AraC family transcriptional regulator [Mucilaginibacter rubeus]|uniref:AraC family transcriptional regulator n=1 Tax=Mucilaginibacter rubeus TaxID=2027860 RepID=A0A5C1I5A0_9SPHI|nr:AraC family transcriptional regulator [Mucilaginibacter rubeus]QEM13014.1 AraC family transcriptional regulator [Mucilaginibacter rubeus]